MGTTYTPLVTGRSVAPPHRTPGAEIRSPQATERHARRAANRMRSPARGALAALLLAGAAARVVLAGAGPSDAVIPSTGQRLTIVLQEPADGSEIRGGTTVRGQCTIGAVPGRPLNVLYVVDVSGSTDGDFLLDRGLPLIDVDGDGVAGGPGDDVNGDGEAGDVLDAEIAGVLALNASLASAPAVRVGVVAFASAAAAADVDPTDGVQSLATPSADVDANGMADIAEVLRSIDSETRSPAGGRIGRFTPVTRGQLGSQTSFVAALAAANAALAGFPPAERNLVFFLSDGQSDPGERCVKGACAAELEVATAAGTTIDTFGVGAGVDAPDLAFIAAATGGTYTPVEDPARLAVVLPSVPAAGLERAEVDGAQVALDALGGFSAPLTCAGPGPRTARARCLATDRDGTAVDAEVTVTCLGICGDGVRDAGEECDDGNATAGDCCGANCRLEPDGSACGSDRDVCNGEEVCRAGVCAAPTPAEALECRTGQLAAAVSNFEDDTVTLLDAETGTVSATVPVGHGAWGVAVHPRGSEVYVTNRRAGTVSVVAADGSPGGTIPVGGLPLGVVFGPGGTRAYVASYRDNRVDVIDTATRSVIQSVPVGRGPSGLAFDPSGLALYVASYGDDTVSVIDATTNTVTARMRTGRRPLQVGVDPRRGRVYVTNLGGDSVSVIGTLSRTVLATLRVGRRPFGIAVDAERGRALVTNAASDTLSVIDAVTSRVVATLPAGRGPLGVGVDLAGRVWLAGSRSGAITVLDPATGNVLATSMVGRLPVAFGPFLGDIGLACPGAALDCDDGDPLTLDTCAPDGGCGHLARTGLDAVRALVAVLDEVVREAPPGALGRGRAAAALVAAVAGVRAELSDGAVPAVETLARRLGRLERVTQKGLGRGGLERGRGLRVLDLARGARGRL